MHSDSDSKQCRNADSESRMPGFPPFQHSGMSRKAYLKKLQNHLLPGDEVSGISESKNVPVKEPPTAQPSPGHWEKPLCDCEENRLQKALEEDKDVSDSESSFVSYGLVTSSDYTSSESSEDPPFEPH